MNEHWRVKEGQGRHSDGEEGSLPFSFRYGGAGSSEYLAKLPLRLETVRPDAERTQTTYVWQDADSGLETRCVRVAYENHPVVEWTISFSNAGDRATGLLEDIQALDMTIVRAAEDPEFALHGHKGDWCTADSYEPYSETLPPLHAKRCAPGNGKSSGGADGWPYYNLQMPGGGIIVAIGWPGQWASSFVRDAGRSLTVRAGQELTSLRIEPGETIRTPLIALLFWKGDDVVDSQNRWRRWMRAHNSPLTEGRLPEPIAHIQLANSEEGLYGEARKFLGAGVRFDVGWRDAAWYPTDVGPFKGNEAWINTGTWEIDRRLFPNGFRAYSDWSREQGIDFLLWFEPERVGNPESELALEHAEWLLEGTTACGPILNLGHPEAWSWLVGRIDRFIREEGLDWYREDMNGPGPLPAWRQNDAPDRQGATENLYVQGHLALWDELRRRHPKLRIDSCASGGRRNDLETMRRAVPLLRSDYQFPEEMFPEHKMKDVYEANQGHTYGLSSWFPYYGSAVYGATMYAARSFYMPFFGVIPCVPDWEKDEETSALVKRAYDENRLVAPRMLGDYYPLSPYGLSKSEWISWQFDRPEEGDGVVQAFRRSDNEEAVRTFRLRGLEEAGIYEVESLDGGFIRATGDKLMRDGLTIELASAPAAAVYLYKRIGEDRT